MVTASSLYWRFGAHAVQPDHRCTAGGDGGGENRGDAQVLDAGGTRPPASTIRSLCTGNKIEKNFEAWLLARATGSGFAEQGIRYPVDVVAAEGDVRRRSRCGPGRAGRCRRRRSAHVRDQLRFRRVAGAAGVRRARPNRRPTNAYEAVQLAALRRIPQAPRPVFRQRSLGAPTGPADSGFIQRSLLPIKALDRANALEEVLVARGIASRGPRAAGPDVSRSEIPGCGAQPVGPEGAMLRCSSNTTSA